MYTYTVGKINIATVYLIFTATNSTFVSEVEIVCVEKTLRA